MSDIILIIIFCLSIALIDVSILEREENPSKGQRYTSSINHYFIAEAMFFIMFGALKLENFPKFLPMFIHITLYYGIISMFLPIIRKYISSRMVMVLWVIPYFMYLLAFNNFSWISNSIIIPVSSQFLDIFYYINLTGGIFVIVWNIISHLKYKKWLLKDAKSIVDQEILNVYEAELKNVNAGKNKPALVMSENAQTPLTIGLFNSKIILPNRLYTKEELTLIFRHELVHILKGDIFSKIGLMFWCAVCWYNPLVWMAKRKCSEDVELSCDETVLLDENIETKKLYAKLILSTATKQTGFTTCLSTNAKGLKYRLENILEPRKKIKGFLFVAVSMFVMMISYGHVSFAYDYTELNHFIANKQLLEVSYFGEGEALLVNEDGLMDYLGNLRVSKLSLNDADEWFPEYAFSYDGVYIMVSEKQMMINTNKEKMVWYYIHTPIDWDIMESFFVYMPEVVVDVYVQDSYMRHFPIDATSVMSEESTIYQTSKDTNIDFTQEKISQLMVSVYTDEEYSLTVKVVPFKGDEYVLLNSSIHLPIENAHYQIIVDHGYQSVYEFDLVIK